MKASIPLDLARDTRIATTLQELSRLVVDESPVISCYLDVRAGRSECQAFLARKAGQIRMTLNGVARLDFDKAVELVRRALGRQWAPGAAGMAVFARGGSGGRHLSVIHTATPFDNRLVLYRRPEVLPLVALQYREPAFTVLHVRGVDLQVIEAQPGAVSTRVAASTAPMDGTASTTAHEHQSGRRSARRDAPWRVRQALADSTAPLILVGEASDLTRVVRWLPRSDVDRLIGTIPVERELDAAAVVSVARRCVSDYLRREGSRLAAELAASASSGDTVMGYRETIDAICRREAEMVVIADWDQPGLGLPWEAQMELCHQALRDGVPVVLADAPALREAGGVACRLREVATASVAGRRVGLGRVA